MKKLINELEFVCRAREARTMELNMTMSSIKTSEDVHKRAGILVK